MTTKKQQTYYNTSSSSSLSSSSSPPGTKNKKTQVPTFFGSPRFKAFIKSLTEAEAMKSPTSILDTKQQFPFSDDEITLNPTRSPKPFSQNKHEGIALALFDELTDDDDNKAIEETSSSSSSSSSSVLIGTKLSVQIPPVSTQSPKSPSGSANSGTQTKVNYTECLLSVTEMELSEEYNMGLIQKLHIFLTTPL